MSVSSARYVFDPRNLAWPERLILAGTMIAMFGMAGILLSYLVLARDLVAADFVVAGVTWSAGFVVFAILGRRRNRTVRSFLAVAIAASAAVLPSELPNLLGGGLALAGAIWGILETYGGEGSSTVA